MTRFRQRYKVESARLSGWDYSAAGWYFVTLCTWQRVCFFGDMVNEKMKLSAIGEIASRSWEDIPRHFSNVNLDAFVLMPNHLHGIVVIEDTRGNVTPRRDVACNVSTEERPRNASTMMARISPRPGSLSVVVRSYKAAVSRFCHLNGDSSFAWQPRFYDHIIRDEQSLYDIREYIINNPTKWELDRDNLENLFM